METRLQSPFLSTTTTLHPPLLPLPLYRKHNKRKLLPKPNTDKTHKISIKIKSSIHPDPWSLSDGNFSKPKPRFKHPKKPLSDDNARRIIKGKAQYLSLLRRNQGPHAMTPKWIKRTPEQMVQYLNDDRNGHMHGKHVVAAIRTVRAMARLREGECDMRTVMASFVGKLTFREMCVVLKEQRGWLQVRDFFAWMKLQLCGGGLLFSPVQFSMDRKLVPQWSHNGVLSYRPSVIVYTIVLRAYGLVGKIKLAEQTFLEMLEVGCEPDEVACGTMLCSYARWGRHKAMMTFYSAVQERKILLSIPVFNFMLSSLQKKSLHGDVVEIWRQMVAKGVAPNHFTYTVVISSLAKQGLYREACEIFDEMKNQGYIPEEVTYSLLISLSSKNGNWDESLRFYDEMRFQKIVPSNYTCASLLTLYYKKEDYSNALLLFSEMERYKIAADEVIYGLLIRIYGKLGLYDDAQKTFEEIERLGLLSDEKTYLAMAQVYLNSRNVEKALNVMEAIKSRNIVYSRFAYIVLLQCYVSKEDMSSAEITFESLSMSGSPDAGACNDMLELYVKLDKREKAKQFIVWIRKNRVNFDEDLCKTVMRVYCKEGMLSDAEQLMDEIERNKLFKDNKFIETFVKALHGKNMTSENVEAFDTMALGLLITLHLACGDSNKMEEIVKILIESPGGLSVVNKLATNFIREGNISKAETLNACIIKQGCRMETETIASLISLYAKQRKLEKAKEIFMLVPDYPVPGRWVFNSMIDAYAKCGKPDEAYLLYTEAIERGHDLGAVAISIVVNALAMFGKHKVTENLVRKSLEDNLELDTVAYNTFIKAMLEAGKLHFAGSIFEKMLSSGVTPSIKTYNTMISVYGRGGKLDKAEEMFNAACSQGLSMDEKAYMNLIGYYGKAGKRHEASILFAEMQEKGLKPGKVSYNIMINVYATAGLCLEAEKLFHSMLRDGNQPDSLTYLSLIRAYAESMNYSQAEKTIKSMQNDGIAPSSAHYNLLISAFAKVGLIKEAERIFKELSETGLNPDFVCYRAMVRCYMEWGHAEEGIGFFEQIKERVESDRFIMSAAAHLYKYTGNEDEAQSILQSMKNFGIKFLPHLKVGSKLKTT
ncbi:hypothetical protein ACFE04_005042 [Oxalis oulophora]